MALTAPPRPSCRANRPRSPGTSGVRAASRPTPPCRPPWSARSRRPCRDRSTSPAPPRLRPATRTPPPRGPSSQAPLVRIPRPVSRKQTPKRGRSHRSRAQFPRALWSFRWMAANPAPALLILTGPIAPQDIPALCRRARTLLDQSDAELVVRDVRALDQPDVVTVEALARVRLTVRRLGRRVRI